MNKFKFYLMSVLACGFSFAFTACGDDDDDKKSSESMNGGNIVGNWVIDEKNTSSKMDGNQSYIALFKSYMGDSNEQMTEILGQAIEFKDDKTFVAGSDADSKEEGTYTTNGSELTMKTKSYELASGKAINIADMMTRTSDEREDGEDVATQEASDEAESQSGFDMSGFGDKIAGAIDATVKSYQYNVSGDKLTIRAVVEMNIDFSKVEMTGTTGTLYDMLKLQVPSLDKTGKITMTTKMAFNRK